ncbi:tetratricopeptide repeat protein [Parapedobacter sp. DT-150]|uniref:sensor histidine kinase n=1 Tax=Parapedobacter sp. DT-150 TaxID=3396162 RepID=UPI003F1CD56C
MRYAQSAMRHLAKETLKLQVAAACLLYSLSGLGQSTSGLSVDSLKAALPTMAADSLKVDAYITLGLHYENNQLDSATFYYEAARALSEALGYSKGIIRYAINYSAVLNMQGRSEESVRLLKEAEELSRQPALTAFLRKVLANIGVAYQYQELYETAVDYYLQALPLAEATDDTDMLSILYSNLVALYRSLRQPEKSMNYAQKAMTLAEASGDAFSIGTAGTNLAVALADAGRHREAIGHLQRAREIGKQLNDQYMQEAALINLGHNYLQMDDFARSVRAFGDARSIAEALGDVSTRAYAMNGVATGVYWQGDYRRSEQLLREGISSAEETGQKEPLRRMLMLMSDVQIALGQPRRSQVYRAKSDSLRQVLLDSTSMAHVRELEAKYESAKREQELTEKDLALHQRAQESKVQRMWLTVITISALLLATLLALGYRMYRQRQQLSRKAIEALQAEKETARLRAKLEGEQQERRRISQEMHDDMGAGLTKMLYLSRGHHDEQETGQKIQETAEGLIRKMNEIIWTMNDEENTLEGLVARIHGTAAELLNDVAIALQFKVDDELPAVALRQEFRRGMYLAVKEAVHNVVKHAGASEVDITVCTNSGLTITVRDNGKGMPPEPPAKAQRNGMKNMQRRLAALGGSVDIASTGGTSVQFWAPWPVSAG